MHYFNKLMMLLNLLSCLMNYFGTDNQRNTPGGCSRYKILANSVKGLLETSNLNGIAGEKSSSVSPSAQCHTSTANYDFIKYRIETYFH